jgi:effector-binding domain-containing protein
MSIEVKVKDVSPMTVAFINMKGDFSQIPAAFQKLYGWISGKGYKPVGPSIAVYHNVPGEVPDEELRWELRSRLSGEAAGLEPDAEGLGVKKLGAVKMAATVYKGSYENIEPVYGALNAWVSANGYELNGPVEELYFNDPAVSGGEPVTEIRFPVRKR